MWAIRVLNGPQVGQSFNLKSGRNLLGRSAQCDIKLVSNGISKEHCEVHVYPDKIMVVDLRSSNGTYINGIKIQNGLLRLGDKLSAHDILLDIVPAMDSRSVVVSAQPQAQVPQMQMPQMQMPQSHHMQGGFQSAPMPAMPPHAQPASMQSENLIKNILSNFEDYLDRVALPGVYRLPELIEFKIVLAGFVGLFIVVVTLLSMIPLVQITKTSILQESTRRARSLARFVAEANQKALLQGQYSVLNTHSVETEEGVSQALIVQQSDGMILAPATRAGSTPNLPFVHKARQEMKQQVVQIDSNTIGASWPIGLYDPSTGEPVVKAHAIILYDVSSLAMDDGRVISLFMQTLVIATVVGIIIFFFLFKLIEFPLVSLNAQLDTAMREKNDNLNLTFQFPALQALIGNINSLLTRYFSGDGAGGSSEPHLNRDTEAANLVNMIGYPCLAVGNGALIIAANASFEQLARVTSAQLQNQSIKSIQDAALQQNIDHLMSKAQEVPQSLHSDQLEFSGHVFNLNCQAFMSPSGGIDYFIISVTPVEGGH